MSDDLRPPPPRIAVSTAVAALERDGSAAYTESAGLPALRAAVANQAEAALLRRVDPNSEVIVTVGAKQAISSFFLATINPGDEVILPEPAWVSYEPSAALAGARVVRVPLDFTDGVFQLDPSRLDDACSSKTKVIIINTPHNPTGAVFSAAALSEIARIAVERDLIVLADECYSSYVFDGCMHTSIASFDQMFDRTITISSVSKIFNMYGWRVGWAIGPEWLIAAMLAISEHTVTCATSFAQAGVAPLVGSTSEIDEILEMFDASREELVSGLNGIPGVVCPRPQGTYFLFPKLERARAMEIAEKLVLAGIRAVDGSAFGTTGAGHIRLHFATGRERAAEMVRTLRECVGEGD
jgi:aspartate/methionine/tyrosine aminotransferase